MHHYDSWQTASPDDIRDYDSCNTMDLGGGILVGLQIPGYVVYADSIEFRSFCDNGLPVYMASKESRYPYKFLHVVEQDWEDFTSTKGIYGGSFQFGIYPFLLSITANFVITLSLTILVFISFNDKRHRHFSWLVKLASALSSITICVYVIRVLNYLEDEHNKFGVTTLQRIIDLQRNNLLFLIIDFISILLLQVCQLLSITRLFGRAVEKRLVFLFGMGAIICANILWAISTFTKKADDSFFSFDILAPFVYLFRIALGASYAIIIITYIIRQRKICFNRTQLTLVTVLTGLMVLLQLILYFCDISNIWIDNLGEIFNITCYLGSTVVVWEWLNRLDVIQRKYQAQSILGRPVYEDEQTNHNFAKYALRLQDALIRPEETNQSYYPSDGDDTTESLLYQTVSKIPKNIGSSKALVDNLGSVNFRTNENEKNSNIFDQESVNRIQFNKQQSKKDALKSKLNSSVNKFINFTDYVVLKSFGTSSYLSSQGSKSEKKKEEMVRKRIGLDKPTNVYLYTTKDIVFDSDDNEEDNDEASDDMYENK